MLVEVVAYLKKAVSLDCMKPDSQNRVGVMRVSQRDPPDLVDNQKHCCQKEG